MSHTIQVGTRVPVFAQGSVLNRMHFRHHGFLQSIIPLVGVELSAECQTPYDCGLGIGVIVLAPEAISWYRNLEELLSCYVSMVQFNYLPFQGIHRSRLTQLRINPTQAMWTDRQNFPRQKGCLQSRSSECSGRAQERSKHRGMGHPHSQWGNTKGI